jgi:hypothetical protein
MKLWASWRTETEDDAERMVVVEVLGTDTIGPDGEASARSEEEDISRQREGELAAAAEEPLASDTTLERRIRVFRGAKPLHASSISEVPARAKALSRRGSAGSC